MTPTEVANQFYEAFAQHDAAAMAACYHPEATFGDPAFGPLNREATCAMWAMLLGRSAELTVTHQVLEVDGQTVRVHWEARYPFSRTGRPVHNRITATLRVEDNLIRAHRDHFNFWAWARQAFGPAGLLLGWTPWFRAKVRAEALSALAKYRAQGSGATR
jgi:ketosteroid isomerase-like protein